MKVGFPGMMPFSIARTAFRNPDIAAEHSECPMLLLIWTNSKELAGPISNKGMIFAARDRLKGEENADFYRADKQRFSITHSTKNRRSGFHFDWVTGLPSVSSRMYSSNINDPISPAFLPECLFRDILGSWWQQNP